MMNKHLKKIILPFYRLWYDAKWRRYLRHTDQIRIVIGSAQIGLPGWFETDILILDVTNEQQFQRFFTRRKIQRVMAEHVLEHLTTAQIEQMLRNFRQYCTADVNIRIAVPDGFHGDPAYIENVRPGGSGNGADDHKHLFTYHSLSEIFGRYGFKAHPLEYWDEQGQFHSSYRNDDKGTIRRSLLNDARNADGKPHYTSLIIDFTRQ
jgi:predicted SAM-dependent methyltransferase